jgi:copper chaperone CopZ
MGKDPNQAQGDLDDLATVVMTVSGMHCASCATLIEEILLEQAGVLGATVDLDSSLARVTVQTSRADFNQLAEAVADVGYQITVSN